MAELLVYETFIHSGKDDLKLNLIKFSSPVHLRELRVIPEGVPPHVELSKTVGATSPATFELNVYCNDSNNPLAPAFEELGKLKYESDNNFVLPLKTKTPTDMVLVRGYYSALSLCVYGYKASSSLSHGYAEPSRKKRRGISPMSDGGAGGGSATEGEGTHSPSRRKKKRLDEDMSSKKDSLDQKSGDQGYEDLFEDFSPDHSPTFDYFDDLGPSMTKKAAMGYEEFSDEEIAFGDDDFDGQEGMEMDYYGDDTWISSAVSFNPYQCELAPLQSLPSLHESVHESLLKQLQKEPSGSRKTLSDEAALLRDLVMKPKELHPSTKWVESLEEINNLLYPCLAQIQKRSSSDSKEIVQKLVGWTLEALSIDAAREVTIPMNVRQLKAGLKLVKTLSQLGRSVTKALVKHTALEQVCLLLTAHNMPTSLKLLALKAIESILEYPIGMERFFGWDAKLKKGKVINKETPYRKIINLLITDQTVRVMVAGSSLLHKAHLYEVMAHLQQEVEKVADAAPVKVIAPLPPPHSPEVEEGQIEEQAEDEVMDDLDMGLGLEEALQGTFTSKPVEEKHDEAQSTTVPEGETVTADTDSQLVKEQSDKQLENSGVKEAIESLDEVTKVNPEECMDTNETSAVSVEDIKPLLPEVLEKIATCLVELKAAMEVASSTIVQPPIKSFPTTARVYPTQVSDCYAFVARSVRARRLLESLLILLSSPQTGSDPAIFSGVRDLLLYLASFQQGLLVLSSNPAVVNLIIRILTQSAEGELPLTAVPPLSVFLKGDNTDECTAYPLGIMLIYYLQVIQAIDTIQRQPKQTVTDLDSPECISTLHTLYSMSLTIVGKDAVTKVFSMDNNITSLVAFIEPRGQAENDNKRIKSSIACRYATMLILVILQGCEEPAFLKQYSSKLVTMADIFKDNQSVQLAELSMWLQPTKELSNDESSVSSLMDYIKSNISQLTISKPLKPGASMITCLRLLKLFITQSSCTVNDQKDLKLLLSKIDIVSSNALEVLFSLLQKVSNILLPSWSQKQPISVANAHIFVALISNCLAILKILMNELLEHGTYKYRDTRTINLMLSIHMVVCSVPHSRVFTSAAAQIQNDIVEILINFTITDSSSIPTKEDEIINNPWCSMLQELLTHTLNAPQCYLSGLMVLSELLPLPLPINTAQPPSQSDAKNLRQQRKLWQAHLQPFHAHITDLIKLFLRSTCVPLQQMLRRVCCQIADISPVLAHAISTLIVESVVSEISAVIKDKDKEQKIQNTKELFLLPLLTTVSVIVQQPVIKLAILDQLTESEQGSDKPVAFILLLSKYLTATPSLPVQLCIMTIFHALSDPFVGLCCSETVNFSLTPQQASNSLPSQDILASIVTAIFSHLTSKVAAFPTVEMSLKILVSLCQHDNGMVHMINHFPKKIAEFTALLQRLIDTYESTSAPSDELLSCTSLFVGLLESLCSPLPPPTCASKTKDVDQKVDSDLVKHQKFDAVKPENQHVYEEMDDDRELGEIKDEDDEIKTEDDQDCGTVVKQENQGIKEKIKHQPYPNVIEEIKEESKAEDSDKPPVLDNLTLSRTVCLPANLVKDVYTESDDKPNKLEKLISVIKVNCKDNETLAETFSDRITEVLSVITDLEAVKFDIPNVSNIVVPQMLSFEEQYYQRTPMILTTTEDTSDPDFWLSTPPYDETEVTAETVRVDLKALASECVPDLNLDEELQKQLLPSPPPSPAREKRHRIGNAEMHKRYKEAMAHRATMAHSGRGKDIFRLRKQNTSRPPSMHVDDFMAMGSGRGRGGARSSHSLGMHPLMASVGGYQQMAAARWYAGMGQQQQQMERRSVSSSSSSVRSNPWAAAAATAARLAYVSSQNLRHLASARAAWGSAAAAAGHLDVYSRLKPSSRYSSDKGDSRTVQMVSYGGSSRSNTSDGWKGRHSSTTYSKRLV